MSEMLKNNKRLKKYILNEKSYYRVHSGFLENFSMLIFIQTYLLYKKILIFIFTDFLSINSKKTVNKSVINMLNNRLNV